MKVTQRLSDLRAQSDPDLDQQLKSKRRELYELRFKGAVGQLEDQTQIRLVRKDIARILTLMHERALSQEHEEVAG